MLYGIMVISKLFVKPICRKACDTIHPLETSGRRVHLHFDVVDDIVFFFFAKELTSGSSNNSMESQYCSPYA